MKRETIAGVLVLGLVLAGVYWARQANDAPQPPRGGDPPDVTTAEASLEDGDLRVTLAIWPRPPIAFQDIKVRARVEVAAAGGSRAAVVLDEARISFEMTMPMGDHRYDLLPAEGGWHEAVVVLPFCPSGNPRWFAIVEGKAGGRRVFARFRLDLTHPGSEPE